MSSGYFNQQSTQILLLISVAVPDTEPHGSADPLQSGKLDPAKDPHQSEKVGTLKSE